MRGVSAAAHARPGGGRARGVERGGEAHGGQGGAAAAVPQHGV